MARVTLKQIEAFVAVAELGSFRRAAARLNTTQPNISNRIAQLESHIGERLLERDAGSVRLTRKGDTLLAPARSAIGAVDAFLVATGDDAIFEGTLRVGVSEMVAHTWLRAFLLRMRDRFPNVAVELKVDLSRDLSSALFAGELDLTLQSGPFEQSSRQNTALGNSPYVWVCVPDLDLPEGPVSADTLLAHPVLTHARGTDPFRQVDDHIRSLGLPARLIPSSNNAICLHMALDGLGVACLPEAMLTDALAEGRLRRIDYGWHPDSLRFAARWMLDPAPPYLVAAVEIAQDLFPPGDI